MANIPNNPVEKTGDIDNERVQLNKALSQIEAILDQSAPITAAQTSAQTITHTGFTDIPGLAVAVEQGKDYHYTLFLKGNNLDQGSCQIRVAGTPTPMGSYTIRESSDLAKYQDSSIGSASLEVDFDASLLSQGWTLSGVLDISSASGTLKIQVQESTNNANGYTISSGSLVLIPLG